MSNIELQNNIIKSVLFINDEKFLLGLSKSINAYISTNQHEFLLANETEKDVSDFNSFTEWNNYLESIDKANVNETLDEFNTSQLELRKLIWDAEHSPQISYKEFVNDIKSW